MKFVDAASSRNTLSQPDWQQTVSTRPDAILTVDTAKKKTNLIDLQRCFRRSKQLTFNEVMGIFPFEPTQIQCCAQNSTTPAPWPLPKRIRVR